MRVSQLRGLRGCLVRYCLGHRAQPKVGGSNVAEPLFMPPLLARRGRWRLAGDGMRRICVWARRCLAGAPVADVYRERFEEAK